MRITLCNLKLLGRTVLCYVTIQFLDKLCFGDEVLGSSGWIHGLKIGLFFALSLSLSFFLYLVTQNFKGLNLKFKALRALNLRPQISPCTLILERKAL